MDGDDVTITWDDGRLSGTPAAVDAVRDALEARDQVRLSPQDEQREADVQDATATMAAIQEVIEITTVEGDPPVPEPDSSAT